MPRPRGLGSARGNLVDPSRGVEPEARDLLRMVAWVLVPMIISFSLTPLLRRVLARYGVIARPDHRSLHETPVPRGAGAAIVLAVLVGAAVYGPRGTTSQILLIMVPTLFGALGLIDDISGLGVAPRLVAEGLISAVAATLLLALGGPFAANPLNVILGLVGVVTFVNVYNFMDGINGLAVLQAVVAGAAWAAGGMLRHDEATVILGAVTAGAALGLLPFNFPRAKIFLGDSGSYGVGAWLGSVALVTLLEGTPSSAVLGPLALFIFDAFTTITRRSFRRENIFQAHRTHIYQRTVLAGWSHAKTTSVCAILMCVLAFAGELGASDDVVTVWSATALAALALVGYALLPRIAASRSLEHE